MTERRNLLRPDRLRTVEHPFGWLPCRVLTNGTIASMSPLERQLYLMLALAADRRGISFYGDQRVQHILGCTPDQLERARTALIARDLLAHEGNTYQLLSTPPDTIPIASMSPKLSQPRLETADAALCAKPGAQTAAHPSGQQQQLRHAMPNSVRDTLRELFGRDYF